MVNNMQLWDEIYMDRNGEKVKWSIAMDEKDHKVYIFEKTVDKDTDISPKIMKSLDGKEEVIKNSQELHLKKWDNVKYEFRIHLVAE